MPKNSLGTPNAVVYYYDNVEFRHMIEHFLEELVDEAVSITLKMDPDYDDLFDIYLSEFNNSEELLGKLTELGYPYEEPDYLKDAVMTKLFVSGWVAFAYLLDNDDFSIRVHITYQDYMELKK